MYNISIAILTLLISCTSNKTESQLVKAKDSSKTFKEGLNNYWKFLDKKNRAISFRRCEGVKKVNNWYGESILTSIIVIEKFSDLPPYIENPLD